jgi:enamine deaminase RidA (YjgF/YER057c/UK114 family)
MILTTRAFHALLGLVLGLVPAHPPQAIRCVESSAGTGSSAAVLVDDAPLVHTAQLLPVDDAGAIVAPADGRAQFDQLMAKLRSTLRASASDLDRLVKLNVYATSDDLAELARRELAGRFTGEHRPAVGFVVTRLPDPAALLALDAVAVSDAVPPPGVVPRTRAAAVLPPGARLYISGQAEPGELPDATRKTLASLSATLRHYGLDDRHAVALKCFVYPMESVAEVQQEIARHFGEAGAPPVSFVAWRSGQTLKRSSFSHRPASRRRHSSAA